MRSKATWIVAAVAVCGLVALVGVAGAAGPAKTKIHIHAQVGGFFGDVTSRKVQKCANNRKVILYKQRGDDPKPRDDKRVGDDIAQPNGDGYMWSINTDRQGDFYALAHKKRGCKRGLSRTRHSQAS